MQAQTFDFGLSYLGINEVTNNYQIALTATPNTSISNGDTADMGAGFYLPSGLTIGNFVEGNSGIPASEWSSIALGSNSNGDAFFVSRIETNPTSTVISGSEPFQLILFDIIANPNPSIGSMVLIENDDSVLDTFFLQNYININLGVDSVDAYNQNDYETKELDFSTIMDYIFISPRVGLQGPLLNPATTGLMNDDLRDQNLLPNTSPYADGVAVDGSPFTTTGNDAIVDWVWVELRDANDNTQVVSAQSALLQRDGDVVYVDGVGDLKFVVDSSADYYVVIKHRNHLGVMSADPITLSQTTTTVDFTDSSFSTYGNHAQVVLASGSMALWAGDAKGDRQVKFSGADNDTDAIKDNVLADPGNIYNFITYSSTGYLGIDVNLDGIGRFSGADNDSNIIKDNVLAHMANILDFLTYTISSNIPSEN